MIRTVALPTMTASAPAVAIVWTCPGRDPEPDGKWGVSPAGGLNQVHKMHREVVRAPVTPSTATR